MADCRHRIRRIYRAGGTRRTAADVPLIVSSTTLHAESYVGFAKWAHPGGNHVALLTVISAVAPSAARACTGTPI